MSKVKVRLKDGKVIEVTQATAEQVVASCPGAQIVQAVSA